MGRNYTGAEVTDSITRLELGKINRMGFIKKGCVVSGSLKWTNGNTVGISIDYTEENPVLNISYTLTDWHGQKHKYDYDIQIVKRPSNLGKGEVLYFICPDSGKRCRILYRAYGYHKWKCREAYKNRIYYPLQLSSKRERYNDKYWQLEYKLQECFKGRGSYTYDGIETKKAAKIRAIIKERNRMDVLRWSPIAMPRALRKFFNGRDLRDCI